LADDRDFRFISIERFADMSSYGQSGVGRRSLPGSTVVSTDARAPIADTAAHGENYAPEYVIDYAENEAVLA